MRKKVGYILSVVISTCIIGLIFFYLFKYFKRHMGIRMQQQSTQQLDQDISALQVLGFIPDSDVLSTLRNYKARMVHHDAQAELPDCERVCALQKKMLMSYVAEAKLLRKRGVDSKSPQMRFAYDKIVRLTIGVAELERQMKQPEDDPSEFQKRVDRMKEITRQSIAHYKKQLRSYAKRGISQDDERMRQARDMLSTRIKHYYQM